MTVENCLLWEKAKTLAQEKGFQMSQKCPMDAVCSGERCTFIDPVKKINNQVEKFYGKLEKHEEIIHEHNLPQTDNRESHQRAIVPQD